MRRLLPFVLIGAVLACGETVASIRLPGLGVAGDAPLAAPAGTWLGFAVHLDSYSYSGRNHVLVNAELLRGGAVVGSTQCRGFEFEGGAGSGCGATEHNSACGIAVPEGGIDAIRVTATLEAPNEVSLEGLEVRVVR